MKAPFRVTALAGFLHARRPKRVLTNSISILEGEDGENQDRRLSDTRLVVDCCVALDSARSAAGQSTTFGVGRRLHKRASKTRRRALCKQLLVLPWTGSFR